MGPAQNLGSLQISMEAINMKMSFKCITVQSTAFLIKGCKVNWKCLRWLYNQFPQNSGYPDIKSLEACELGETEADTFDTDGIIAYAHGTKALQFKLGCNTWTINCDNKK